MAQARWAIENGGFKALNAAVGSKQGCPGLCHVDVAGGSERKVVPLSLA